jgi:putative chitinase
MAKKWSAIKQREQDEYKKREFGSDMSPALSERSGSSLPDLIESEIREGWKDWAKAGALAASLAGGAHAQDFQVVDQIPPEHHLMHLPNGEDIVISNQYNDQQALQIIKQKYPELLQTKQPAPAQQAPTITAQTIEDIKQMVAKPMGKYLMKCAKLHGLAGDELVQFLAQTSHESSEFDKFNENLNYSAERLMQVFPKAFTPKTAKKYAHKPRAIANHVYANVNGNGDEASGDGWKYRGRGFIHLTGRENYQNAAKALNIPLETKPDLASNPQVAAQVALWFWDQHVKPRVSDYSNTQAVTKPINKGLEGLKNRETKFIGLKQLMANRK